MKGFKGFHKGLVCRGKQYAENTVFEEPEANICENGMHFCENPFDVLDYYGFVDNNGELNEFATVEALDEVETDDGKKYCTKKLRIGAKLSFAGFIKACIDFVIEKTIVQTTDDAAATGYNSKVATTGDCSKVATTGDCSKVAATGYNSKVAATGYCSKVAATGNCSKVATTGDCSNVAATGNCSKVAATGYNSKVAATGYCSTVATTGDDSTVAATGNDSKVAATGNCSTVATTGYNSTVATTGDDCIICCTGADSRVKAKRGSWITLSEWKYDEKKERYVPAHVKTEFVDGERIKEDVYYILKDGEFQEVNK